MGVMCHINSPIGGYSHFLSNNRMESLQFGAENVIRVSVCCNPIKKKKPFEWLNRVG